MLTSKDIKRLKNGKSIFFKNIIEQDVLEVIFNSRFYTVFNQAITKRAVTTTTIKKEIKRLVEKYNLEKIDIEDLDKSYFKDIEKIKSYRFENNEGLSAELLKSVDEFQVFSNGVLVKTSSKLDDCIDKINELRLEYNLKELL